MRFACRDSGLSDLPRRGLTPQEALLEVLRLDIEATLRLQSPAAGHEMAEIEQFDRSVREGVAAMGIEPAFLPEP